MNQKEIVETIKGIGLAMEEAENRTADLLLMILEQSGWPGAKNTAANKDKVIEMLRSL